MDAREQLRARSVVLNVGIADPAVRERERGSELTRESWGRLAD